MSALRHMLASLWAALWLGWRMAGVRTRRLLGRRGRMTMATATGHSVYLPAAEIPVEGVGYDLGELPADLAARLVGVRAELVGAARGTTARQVRRRKVRRRRTASLAMAALLTLAVLGAGATALMTGSTGVPEVDRLLGINQKILDQRDDVLDRIGPTSQDLQPRSRRDSNTVETTIRAGWSTLSTAYVARSGAVCVASIQEGEPGGSSTAADVIGTWQCPKPKSLAEQLARDQGVVVGFRQPNDGIVILNGFVSSDVEAVTGVGRAFAVRLGETWRPEGVDVGELRQFIAVGRVGRRGMISPAGPLLEAENTGGRRSEFGL
jgi:hypothetical protein